jgi:L-threonylcarbamoyladenylate synthase
VSDAIVRAVEVLRAGGLVAFPTETVYGLGADAQNGDAVRRLFAVKGRPPSHPVIAHLGAQARLDDFAHTANDDARALAAAFWPGPLTIVLTRRPGAIVDEVTGGRDTVGLRVPDHPLALGLLDAFGGAVAAPSANRFGRVSPTTAQHVRADLGDDVDLVLDGGPSRVGVESTIVDCTSDEIAVLRVGGVALEEVERILGRPLRRKTGGEVAAPGTLAAHYAPRARVEIVDHRADLAARAALLLSDGESVGVLCLGAVNNVPVDAVVLGPPGDTDEYARTLYARLREADELGLDVVLAVPPLASYLGTAVADRLERAAHREPSH